jgi:small subunit ribosomal protein S16
MVVIRLARGGSKKRPFYNVVATDRQNRRDGRFIERVGYYNPVASGKEQGLLINVERVQHWTAHGAQVSPAVSRLIKAQADRAASAPQ